MSRAITIAENWLPAPGFEWRYEVSDLGRVRNTRTGRVLKPTVMRRHGYAQVGLYNPGELQPISCRVHILVARAFTGLQIDPAHQVCHEDGVKTNNAASNLRWDTAAGNAADRIAHGTHKFGETVGTSKLTNDQAADIKGRLHLGETGRALAKEFAVSEHAISKLKTGKNWAWL